MANPQKENGYTTVAHEILEALAKAGITGLEAKIIFLLLRKTYGYRKKRDKISLTQFKKGTDASLGGIRKALARLESKKIITIRKREIVNDYELNKDHDQWLCPARDTAPHGAGTMPRQERKLCPARGTTIDIITKDKFKDSDSPKGEPTKEKQINEIGAIFYNYSKSEVAIKHKQQREATRKLIKKHGFEQTKAITQYAIAVQGKAYAPTIVTPIQLTNKMGELRAYGEKEKNIRQKQRGRIMDFRTKQ